ncbi:uncharacterized protein LOC111370364 [Olea europaea var. sylvestris]|uniref:Uncharacterized protein n=1 Tax=Olea europaea subsp. europaea TaxID=158383 RepID=A0A8S0R9Z9_OLEEU|nr:uncharacterized protein LOC111370364 [Olea europaea var. sylvestris]CAA2975998.1 Hypothetical predicted protein [Olea europaea subsp. europaea]
MKKSGLFAAAVAASAAAISASSSSKIHSPHQEAIVRRNCEISTSQGSSPSSSTDKFAPRFDGLRFIETLVTAHR